jgi:hypothetical protein
MPASSTIFLLLPLAEPDLDEILQLLRRTRERLEADVRNLVLVSGLSMIFLRRA